MLINIFNRHRQIFLLLFLLIIIGGFFRFYNLNWGAPFYFHPDERNIISSVIQLSYPTELNPHFFAYGSFPIYLTYFTSLVVKFFQTPQDLFAQLVMIGRFYSTILSILLIPSMYFVGREIAGKKVGFLAAIISTFSVGLIQFAHFGTVEMWLTFLGLWFFYFSGKLIEKSNIKNTTIVGFIFGILMATKISSLPLILLPITAMLFGYFSKFKAKKKYSELFKKILNGLILISVSFVIFAILSPYVFLDFKAFLSSMQYESSVALGTLPVFYTAEFFNSVPILFQFIKIYPFLINPLLTIIFIPSFFYLSFAAIKTKNQKYLMLNLAFLILFLPQAFLFTKWTRYMIPTLTFIYLIISITLINLFKIINLNFRYFILCIIFAVSLIYSISYFMTAFAVTDTRIQAGLWAKNNIENANTVSEVYDLGLIAFNPYFSKITMFNFYDLDNAGVRKIEEIDSLLSESKYIILPSNRILKTRLTNPKQFPIGHDFYTSLFNNKLGFTKIYETPCDIFCRITYLNNPTFSFEYTASVFDRPTVFIFKKR